jgi:hypothetical protein
MTEIVFAFDSEAAAHMDTFTRSGAHQALSFVSGKDQKKHNFRLNLDCECLGDLIVSDYGHSVLCRVDSSDDLSLFEMIEETAAASLPTTIDFRPFIKDEKFFMKLQFKNDKYRASIDPTFAPSKPEQAPFHQGARLKIDCSVSMWINYANSNAGLMLGVNKVIVDGGKKRTLKRR